MSSLFDADRQRQRILTAAFVRIDPFASRASGFRKHRERRRPGRRFLKPDLRRLDTSATRFHEKAAFVKTNVA